MVTDLAQNQSESTRLPLEETITVEAAGVGVMRVEDMEMTTEGMEMTEVTVMRAGVSAMSQEERGTEAIMREGTIIEDENGLSDLNSLNDF